MRIRSIRINSWRHFRNIELKLDDDARLVCIVGANGTGKTHLLELIAACAQRLGLSQGIEAPRGDPFSDTHDFSLEFFLAAGVSGAVDEGVAKQPEFHAWDRTLIMQSRNDSTGNYVRIEAGGLLDAVKSQCATFVVQQLRQSKDIHFLSLDANRAYPKKSFNIHEIAQAYETDWEGEEFTRGRSFKATSALYDEWIKYFLGQENQSATRHIKDIRRARQAHESDPVYIDNFVTYRESLQKVLPHVVFVGIDARTKTLLFDTTGMELSFDHLSGGEREIAFLIGQIDRFGLRTGLFLLDEPELHLNADLIRVWVGYLTSTVETGQIWLATHSLEAVEAAGQQSTFVFERRESERTVNTIARLDSRPVLSALSRAVGTPAFSISQLQFVFIEGEESLGERERFRKLAGAPQSVRFMECGSCREVLRRVETIRSLAKEAEAGIRIAGVVDRDFRTQAAVNALLSDHGVYALAVHEIENFFLHPATLRILLEQNGRGELVPVDLVREASDSRAGCWIFQHALATPNAKALPDIPTSAKERAKRLSWAMFEADRVATVESILAQTRFEENDAEKFKKILVISADAYQRNRDQASFWKDCEGKEVLNQVARGIGYSDASALTLAAFAAWDLDESRLPEELVAFRSYLAAQ